MNRQVLIVSFSFEQEPEAFEILKNAGLEPVLLAEKDRKGFDEEAFINYWENLAEQPAGIIMGADIPLGEKFLHYSNGLEAISLNCAGSDHLDLEKFKCKGITICNVPKQNYDAVADFAWGLILGLMRQIPRGDKIIRQGEWCKGVERGIAVSGKTLGIIGFGAIGQAIAKRAAGFDMNTIVSSTSKKPELKQKYNITYVERNQLFQIADIIVPTCPYVKETHHMINEDTIGMMGKQAVLINCARGGIIDTRALYEALHSNRIAGAALDVYEEEPLRESPLFSLDNVVFTPHMGGLADREIHNVAIRSAVNMVKLLSGQKTGSEL